jgi:hypothetical protein
LWFPVQICITWLLYMNERYGHNQDELRLATGYQESNYQATT